MVYEYTGKGFGGVNLYSARNKRYRCSDCGYIGLTYTNHFHYIYIHCPYCNAGNKSAPRKFECMEDELIFMAKMRSEEKQKGEENE